MEQRIIRLLKLNFNLDDFYAITLNPEHYAEEITLQGSCTPEKLLKYTQMGYSFQSVSIGVTCTKEKIKINLT
jgi:hypothetical protein